MAANADDTFSVAFESVGADEVVADLGKVRQAQDRITKEGTTQAAAAQRQSATVVQATQSQATAVSGLGSKWGQLAGAMGSVGPVVGSLSPQLGQLVGIIGSVGSASTALTGAMGPVGVVVGAITTAIGIASIAYQAFADDADDVADAQHRAATNTRDFIKAMRERVQAERDTRANERSLTIGQDGNQATGEEIGLVIDDTRAQISTWERRIATERQRITQAQQDVDAAFTSGRSGELARASAELETRRQSLESMTLTVRELRREEERLTDAQVVRVSGELAGGVTDSTADTETTEQNAPARARERTAAETEALRRHREMVAERDRIDRTVDEAAETYHQNALRRIGEMFDELERTGDIMSPVEVAAGNARSALKSTFEQLDKEDARRRIAREGGLSKSQASVRGAGADMGFDLEEYRDFVESQGSMDEERTQRYQSALHAREDAHQAHVLALRDMEAMGTDWTQEQFNRRLALHNEMLAQQRADSDATQTRLREAGEITSGMWETVGGSVVDAAGSMFKFLITGAEGGEEAFVALLDQFLQATAIEYTIKALGEGANAAAAYASLDPVRGSAHLAAAGLAAAVAAATGLASAAIQSAPAASAGGAAEAGAGATAGGGVTNITVQIYSPNAVHTEAERAELIAHSFREAERMRPGSARI